MPNVEIKSPETKKQQQAGKTKTAEMAFIVPGHPHLAFENTDWQELKNAYKKAGEHVKAANPDVLVVYSAQWMSVLGHSFQADPNPKGYHVDENWYELGDFPFNFKVDVDLANAAEANAKKAGLATKLVNYEGFPIDTGTLVMMKYLNPENKIPVVIVSSNVYAGQEDSETLGKAVAEAVQASGKKAVFVLINTLSNRYITEQISPEQDCFSSKADDEWNQKFIGWLKEGQNKQAVQKTGEYAQGVNPEMGLKGFYWLMAALDCPETKATVLGYGPVWGTGAAVIEYDFRD